MFFWERFYKLCIDNNTKPLPVVKELKIAAGSITKWKNGSVPNADTVLKLAEYFGVSTDYLLGVTDRSNPAEPPAPEMTEQDKEFCSDYLNLSEQGKEYMRQTMDMVKEKYIKDTNISNMEAKIG